MDLEAFVKFKNKIIANVRQVVVGKDDIIELVIIAFIYDFPPLQNSRYYHQQECGP